MSKKILYLLLIIFIGGVSWWFGQPGDLPPGKIIPLPSIEANVKGAYSDKMPPTSSFDQIEITAGKSDVITGKAIDLGTGVAEVVLQLQRSRDGAVWNGKFWQESVGEAQSVQLSGQKFSYIIPLELVAGERYILRSQAIDFAGNTQTQWSSLKIIGQTKLFQAI